MHTLNFKYRTSPITDRIVQLLKEGPLTSSEVQKQFEPGMWSKVRSKLSRLYRYGHLVRSPFKTSQGYIYSLPEHKDKILNKLQQIVPAYVRNSLQLILTQKKIFTLNELVELTNGNFETMEYYLTQVFSRQLNWIKNSYYKGFKIFWSSNFDKEGLLEDFVKRLSEVHRNIKVQGKEFEKEVERLLDRYLLNLPIKVEKDSTGTPSGKYFDLSYKLYLFDQPIHLKVEIKSYIPNLYQVALFYKKFREFKYGSVVPVMIAPAFPSVVYQTFGDTVYLLPLRKLEEITKVVLSTRSIQ